ncbi:MAG: MFS transporter [Chloroflexi bacterium]|nr:MFS transporter [Chloroflexota bacterium]
MLNVIILGITSFLTDFSTEMVYPLLPLYLTSARIGASPAIVGLIEGIAESLASILKVFSGYISDRFRTRKPLTILGYSASTIGKIFLYISTTWQIVLIGRIIDRFGKGIRTAPRDALIADSTDSTRRGAAYGLHRALDTFGAVAGVAVAYVLFVTLRDDFQPIFLFSLIPALLAVVVLCFVREKTSPLTPLPTGEGKTTSPLTPLPTGEGKKEIWWRNLRSKWQGLDRRLKFFLVIVFVFSLGNSSNQFLILRATSLGYDDAAAILLYLLYNVVYAIGAYPFGHLSDRIGRKKLLVAGYAVYGAIYLGFGVTGATLLPILFGMYGLYIALTEGVEKALVSELAPAPQRATLIGLHATAIGVGLLPASLLAGVLWDASGAPAPFFFGGALGLAAAIALWRLI